MDSRFKRRKASLTEKALYRIQMLPQSNKLQPAVVAVFFLLAFFLATEDPLAQKPSPSASFATATQAPPSSAERAVSTGDTLALLAFYLLKTYLPPGTHLASGFRTSQDQTRIIRQYAEHEDIPVPNEMKADDPKTWGPVLARLRAAGYKIADPGKSQHENENLIVLDLSRPPLSEIQKGCLTAQDKGIILITHTIKEHKNGAFHIELQITEKALALLGLDTQLLKRQGDDQALKTQVIGEMREKLRGETDPQKRASQLKDIQKLAVYGDQAYLALQTDIDRSEEEAKQLAQDNTKRKLLEEISNARDQQNWELAKEKALQCLDLADSRGCKNLVEKIEAQEFYEKAVELVLTEPAWQCDQCKDALNLVEQALEKLNSTTPKLPSTMEAKFQRQLSARVNSCWWRFVITVSLIVILAAILLVGLFFALRPGQLFLECVDGDLHGESFALVQAETVIGSLGEPDGEAHIVINDRKRKISRSHCLVRRSGRRFYLKDISANGTSVNGRPLAKDEYHELRKGDEISLADAATLIVRRK
jgi:hypothetical protein